MNKTINQAYNVYFLYKMRYNVVIRVVQYYKKLIVIMKNWIFISKFNIKNTILISIYLNSIQLRRDKSLCRLCNKKRNSMTRFLQINFTACYKNTSLLSVTYLYDLLSMEHKIWLLWWSCEANKNKLHKVII